MGFESDLDKKYLDPAVNPMLPGSTAPPFEKKPEEPDPHLDPGRNPMIGVEDVRAGIVEAAILSDRLAAVFSDKNELELGGFKVVKMAAGNFTVNGRPLAELEASTLEAIAAALQK